MASKGEWSSGLFGCFSDCGTLCMTCWCPCIQIGRNIEIISEGLTDFYSGCCIYYLLQAFTGCGCIYSCGWRARLREKYSLPESPCHDVCLHCFCIQCAICQEGRELKARGYNPALGWQAYKNAPPPVQQMRAM